MLNLRSSLFLNTAKLVVLFILLGTNCFAQTNSDNLIQTMDSLFFKEDGNKRPGYSIAIVKDDSVIYRRSIGHINVEKNLPFTENSIFAIASCTKQFVGFGILMLEREAKLKLTDDIRTYIPELPEYEHTVTIKHLLSHTSGIRDHLTLLGWENKQRAKYYTFEGTISGLQKYPGLSFQPGENFAYSNTGYTLLALLIERISGQNIEEFMRERIFEPLEMHDTHFEEKRDYRNWEFTRPYNYNIDKDKFITYRRKEVNAMGAVGIYTTINDFIKWDENFTSMKVGNEALFDKFLQSDTLNNGLPINYNNGLKERFVKGYHVVEHSGGWAFYNFQYTRIPELGLSVIIASNNELDYPIGMAETYIKTILPNDRVIKYPPVKTEQTKLQSTLYLSENFTFRTIETNGDSARIIGTHMYGSKVYQLNKLSNGNYIDSTGNELVKSSRISGFRWSGGGYFNVPTEFHALQMVTYDLQKMEGKYENPELGSLRIRYKKKDDTIKLKSSFGKNPKIKSVFGQFIDLNSVGYDLLIKNENTLMIGNSIVFNLEFTRK